jgi:hypothetical protein
LDDWIYYFKHYQVPQKTNAKSLDKVSKFLIIDNMDPKTKHDYEAYIKDQSISRNMLATAKIEGSREGEQSGRQEGIYISQVNTTIESFKNGLDYKFISLITGLSEDEIIKILK